MSDQIQALEITLTPFDNRRLINLCGRFDEHLRQIERQLRVEIANRGNTFQLIGSQHSIEVAAQVLKNLYQETSRGTEITPSQVHLSLRQYAEPNALHHPHKVNMGTLNASTNADAKANAPANGNADANSVLSRNDRNGNDRNAKIATNANANTHFNANIPVTRDGHAKSHTHKQDKIKSHYSVSDTNFSDIRESFDTAPSAPALSIRTRAGEVRPRSANQIQYLHNILTQDVNFGIGPAGTGKTFLAVAAAVSALEQEKVRRIVLVRPAVEAGERLGFLPGDLAQKIDPYLRPLYDALYEMLGYERVAKLLERQIIEIAPLAYMRGRTLNDAFIILDEGQNATTDQMKMFLTRIGFSSTAVITGDITQIDLPRGRQSGLKQVMTLLKNIPGISFTFFQSIDVVRHPIVQKIIDAYEDYEFKKTSALDHRNQDKNQDKNQE